MRGHNAAQRLRRSLAGGAVVIGAGFGTAFAYGQITGPIGSDAPETVGQLAAVDGAGARQSSVLVCQATGDGSYVTIRVLPDRLDEYRQNPNNIVPAPAGGCPARVAGGTASTSTATAPPTQTQTTLPPITTIPSTSTATATSPKPKPKPKPATTTKTTATRKHAATPAPKTTTATPAPTTTKASTTPAPTTTTKTTAVGSAAGTPTTSAFTGRLKDLNHLPNTGSASTAFLLLGGFALMLGGVGLRLRTRPVRW